MSTEYRALCAELLEDADELADLMQCVIDGDYVPDSLTLQPIRGSMARACAALSQSEPVGPTDEELKAAYWEAFVEAAPCGADESWLAGLRAVARLGHPIPQPIPVSARLPGAEDYDSDRVCWWWNRYLTAWCLCDASQSESIGLEWTHWLPHWALLVPTAVDAPGA